MAVYGARKEFPAEKSKEGKEVQAVGTAAEAKLVNSVEQTQPLKDFANGVNGIQKSAVYDEIKKSYKDSKAGKVDKDPMEVSEPKKKLTESAVPFGPSEKIPSMPRVVQIEVEADYSEVLALTKEYTGNITCEKSSKKPGFVNLIGETDDLQNFLHFAGADTEVEGAHAVGEIEESLKTKCKSKLEKEGFGSARGREVLPGVIAKGNGWYEFVDGGMSESKKSTGKVVKEGIEDDTDYDAQLQISLQSLDELVREAADSEIGIDSPYHEEFTQKYEAIFEELETLLFDTFGRNDLEEGLGDIARGIGNGVKGVAQKVGAGINNAQSGFNNWRAKRNMGAAQKSMEKGDFAKADAQLQKSQGQRSLADAQSKLATQGNEKAGQTFQKAGVNLGNWNAGWKDKEGNTIQRTSYEDAGIGQKPQAQPNQSPVNKPQPNFATMQSQRLGARR